ncbi:MAG: glutamine-hydrolyzing carbamoyl-phosphate synthase small subunit [Candidatus Freyarchaeota archaeon]
MVAVSFHKNPVKAVLALEDGSYFVGYGFGATREVSGEVVFSTSMVGYPEALTDPSYKGQILVLTYPLIGNYGVPPYAVEKGFPLYFESSGIKVSGLIVHEVCEKPHHWTSTRNLHEWLEDEGIPGIYGIDTRRLTKKLRVEGVMLGILKLYEAKEKFELEELLGKVKEIPDPNLRKLVAEVSVQEPIYYEHWGRGKIVLLDCGVKYSILRNLIERKVDVVQVPYNFSAKEILEYNPKGVLVSNGPGDPKKCEETVKCVRELVEENVSLMGIGLGNQILALALGGDTYKLKYGHRSQNQPVVEMESSRCYITTQNHGYAVDAASINQKELKVWFLNANDKTVEGIKHLKKPVFGVQWHPEGAPDPYGTRFLFDEFLKAVRR